MSIRPVDMQIVMPKSVEPVKQNSQQDPRPDLFNQHVTQEMNQQVVRQMQRTAQTEHTVNKDGHNKQEQERKKREQKRRELEKAKADAIKPEKTSMFDFTV